MSSIPLADIAEIVLAARVQRAPAVRFVDGGPAVHILTLRGLQPDELYDFTLDEGHRRWRLEAVSDAHGVNAQGRTLGRRLSARLNVLHGTAAEHFAPRPPDLP
jgi:hypothetical protein